MKLTKAGTPKCAIPWCPYASWGLAGLCRKHDRQLKFL